MIENSQFLEDAEREVARLAKQAEQEKAMAEVLPARFEKNIAIFKKIMPHIADTFEFFKPTRPFEIFCSENGIPNLRWLDNNTSIYTDDPYLDCKEQIDKVINNARLMQLDFSMDEKNPHEQIHVTYMNLLSDLHKKVNKRKQKINIGDSIPLVILFGVGLGYHLGYLYESVIPKNLFIFEPDRNLFYASLFSFDWHELLTYLENENLGLHLFIGQDENNLMQDMQKELTKRGLFLSSNSLSFFHYPSEEIFKLAMKVTQEFYLLNTGWGFFDDNLFAIAHSAENISMNIPFLLNDKYISPEFEDIPVFVVGNGPSLDAAIPYIRKHQHHAIIISCGSSISALYRAGIQPDICVAIERTKGMADFYGIIDNIDYLKDILFFSSDVIHPDCHKYFKRSAMCFKGNEPVYILCANNYKPTYDYKALRCLNPLVGNIGLSFPVELGFKNIYMFGLDNGYKDIHHHHSKFSAYYDKNGNPIEALTKLVTKRKGINLPGNFGGTVVAHNMFALSAKVMSVLLKSKKDINCFNCSDGVYVDGAKPLHLEEIIIPEMYVDKKQLINKFYSDCFSPFPVDASMLKSKLATDVFNNVVDDIIKHWVAPIKSRADIIERMQQIHEYIYSLIMSGYPHIYRVLIGTITYVFSSILVLVFKTSKEEEINHVIYDAIKIMTSYFEETKIKYAMAFDSIDMTCSESTQHFHRTNN